MYSSSTSNNEISSPFLVWQKVLDWAQEHYRCRTFSKDEKIPTRPGLLYLVHQGAVRLVGEAQFSGKVGNRRSSLSSQAPRESSFLGLIGAGYPFEVVVQSPYIIQSIAHVDQTTVIWMYWDDVDIWPHFRREVLETFRYQHQRMLLRLNALGQRRTIDRLLAFLTLLIEDHGEPSEEGYYLPWVLTHAQIASAIGATRVTVTRSIGKLRQKGLIRVHGDGLLGLPAAVRQSQQPQS
jgi:CRP-like cAMP-binding protein